MFAWPRASQCTLIDAADDGVSVDRCTTRADAVTGGQLNIGHCSPAVRRSAQPEASGSKSLGDELSTHAGVLTREPTSLISVCGCRS